MWLHNKLPFFLLAIWPAFAQLGSPLPPICDAECQKSCNATCQKTVQQVYELEASQWAANASSDPFYVPPANLSNGKPGDILRWVNVSPEVAAANWTIPAGLSVSRFLYVSQDVNGKPIPASAWALLPYEQLQTNGSKKFRTVVWTRGTTGGQNPNCATSNHKTLYEGWRSSFVLAEMGYAVIAPDYAGQGPQIASGFAYMAAWVHASGAALALAAARKTIGAMLTDEWIVYGHSEGGAVAWRTNERLATPGQSLLSNAAGRLIGTVSVSPVLRPGGAVMIDAVAQRATSLAFVMFYALQSMAKLYPSQFKLADWVKKKALQRFSVLNASCQGTAGVAFSDLSDDDLYVNSTLWQTSYAKDWDKRYNNPGPHKLASPMLVMHGLEDIIPYQSSTYDYNLTCAAYPRSRIHLRLLPGMNHLQTLDSTKGYVVQWIQDRFNGAPIDGYCTQENVVPATNYAGQNINQWIGFPA